MRFVSNSPSLLVLLALVVLAGAVGWHFSGLNLPEGARWHAFLSLGIVLFLALVMGIILFWWHTFRSSSRSPVNSQEILTTVQDLELSDLFSQSRGLLAWLEKNVEQVKQIYSNLERISQLLGFINYSIELPRQLRLALSLAHEIFPRAVISVFLWRHGDLELGMASRQTDRGLIEELAANDVMVLQAQERVREEVDLEKLRQCNGRAFSLPLRRESRDARTLVMPLILWNRVLGIIVFQAINQVPFSEEEKVISILLNRHIAVFIENHYLYQEKIQQQRVLHEIDIAAQIQENSLPTQVPVFSGFDFDFFCLPCHEISGDYYDVIPRSDDRMLVAIADVSGKGFPAALFLSKIQTLVRAMADETDSPAALLTFLSRQMVREQMGSLFATMFIALIRTNSLEVVASSAGHCKPLVIRSKAGFVEEVTFEVGIPLGLFEPSGDEYQDQTLDLLPGDGVFLYSDGLPDLVGPERARFGTERLKSLLEQNTELSPKHLLELLKSEVRKFRREIPLEDDVTMVYFKSESATHG